MSTSPIFVGGVERSGTTLVRVILNSHPHIACGPELGIPYHICELWWTARSAYQNELAANRLSKGDVNRVFAGLLLELLNNYRQQTGKPRAAEKTPNNVLVFEHLNTLFPQSPLIHCIRDGRDVVCSLLTMNWLHYSSGKPWDITRDAAKAAERWVQGIRTARGAARKPDLRKRYHELRYEELVADPETSLRELFAFIDEPWDPVVLEFHRQGHDLSAKEASTRQVTQKLYTSAVGRWQQDLSAADKSAIKQVAGDLLIELGYAADYNW